MQFNFKQGFGVGVGVGVARSRWFLGHVESESESESVNFWNPESESESAKSFKPGVGVGVGKNMENTDSESIILIFAFGEIIFLSMQFSIKLSRIFHYFVLKFDKNSFKSQKFFAFGEIYIFVKAIFKQIRRNYSLFCLRI